MKYCKNDHPVISSNHYCPDCGDYVREVQDFCCPNGHRSSKLDAFCTECGVQLKVVVSYMAGYQDESITDKMDIQRPWYKRLLGL